MKHCAKCEQPKPSTEFYKSKSRPDGLRAYCKVCEQGLREAAKSYTRDYNRLYYEKRKPELLARMASYQETHRDSLREYQAAYRQQRRTSDAARDILVRCRTRARKHGIAFDLTVDDIVIPESCPVLGIPLVRRADGKKGGLRESPSIDRIDPSQGYVRGNVRIISNRANTLKNDATVAELERVLADLRRIKPV